MVLMQCLACNSMIPSCQRSCSCGHVLEEKREIGGKRFSGYRAELYSRLETKRMKMVTKEAKENQPIGQFALQHPETDGLKKQGPVKERKLRTSFKHTDHVQRTKKRRKGWRRGSKIAQTAHSQPEPQALSSEFMARFPGALDEINRRLLGQSLFWRQL